MMRPMSMPLPSDRHILSAALGWIELGNPGEARLELRRLSPAARASPDALEVEWVLCAGEEDWVGALRVAEELVRADPERSSGWLHRAYALRRVPEGGLQAAWDALAPAHARFQTEPTIPYNLACYACQLGRMDEARVWVRRAFELGGIESIKRMALHDTDLEPLWGELRGM
jgi:hypothetical protein